MANPIPIDIPADTWKKVCDATTDSIIDILEPRPGYRVTSRTAGLPGPATLQDIKDAPRVKDSLQLVVSNDVPIDVWMYVTKGPIDGRVVVTP